MLKHKFINFEILNQHYATCSKVESNRTLFSINKFYYNLNFITMIDKDYLLIHMKFLINITAVGPIKLNRKEVKLKTRAIMYHNYLLIPMRFVLDDHNSTFKFP